MSTWARNNHFPPAVVYSVLSGRTCGRRGTSHRVAVALGLKLPPNPLAGPAAPGTFNLTNQETAT